MDRLHIFSSLILLIFLSTCSQPKNLGDKPYDLQRFDFEINAKTFYPANPRDSLHVPYTTDNYDFRANSFTQHSLICREYNSISIGNEKFKTEELAKWGNLNFTSFDLFESEKDSVLAIRCTAKKINPIETDKLIANITKDFGAYKNLDSSKVPFNYFWAKSGKRIKLIVKQSDFYAPKEELGEASMIRQFKENIVLYIYKLKFVPLSERIIYNADNLRDFKDFEIPDEKKYLPDEQFRW